MLSGNNCYTSLSANCAEKCAICKGEVPRGQDTTVERKTVHKSCFVCGYCGRPLQIGSCAIDHSLSRYGLIYFCHDHMMLPPGEKATKLDKNKKAGGKK